jgi:hypothetical protein
MRYSENRRYRDSSFTMTSEPIVQDEIIEPVIEEVYQELVESIEEEIVAESFDLDTPAKISHWSALKAKLSNLKGIFKR